MLKKANQLPKVTVVIPTLNAGSVLEKCLESIEAQHYPKEKVEIVISDGGSTDNTKDLARKYRAKLIKNELKTGEAGKAVGVRAATGEIIALIDSDNILPDDKWLKKMVKPLVDDPDIVVSEPIEYSYRKSDPYLTRYFALLGMNDPICLFIGNYDRACAITGRWTDLKLPEENRKDYLKVTLNKEPIPTIGANGTLIRRSVLMNAIGNSGYLFDIDILIKLIRSQGEVKIAKVKTGIVHTFVENDAAKFFRKQLRRINDMSYHKSKKNRDIDWERSFMSKIMIFVIQCGLVVPIIYQTIKGYLAKPDIAWLFHPVACYSTLFIYLYGWLKGKVSPEESSRKNWSQ